MAHNDLVDFRNAIAHANETKLSAIAARTNVRSTKASFSTYRRTLERLAPTIDVTVAAQLSGLLGIATPW